MCVLMCELSVFSCSPWLLFIAMKYKMEWNFNLLSFFVAISYVWHLNKINSALCKNKCVYDGIRKEALLKCVTLKIFARLAFSHYKGTGAWV